MSKPESATDFLDLQQKLDNMEEELEKYRLSAEESQKAIQRLDQILAAMHQEQIQYRETNDQKLPSWER